MIIFWIFLRRREGDFFKLMLGGNGLRRGIKTICGQVRPKMQLWFKVL